MEPDFMTARWRTPGQLRRQRLSELVAKDKYAGIFNDEFMKGLERRKEILEARSLKGLGFQIPLFLMLVFALLKLRVSVSIWGVTPADVASLREAVVVISAAFSLFVADNSNRLSDTNNMLKAVIQQRARSDADLKAFLEARYGVGGGLSYTDSFSGSLHVGRFQIFAAFAIALMGMFFVFALFGLVFVVHVATLLDIYRFPNFNPAVSLGVIAFVLIADVLTLSWSYLNSGLQPFKTDEDFLKLVKLEERDPERYQNILRDMAVSHARKGGLFRLISRPKMKRIKDQ